MNCDGYEKSHISAGPWGGQCGARWDDGVHCTIRKIIISHGAAIDSIQFEYDSRGSSVWSEKHGGSGSATKTDKIKLNYPDERLISISGHYGSILECGPVVVRSLMLESNKKRYGPFGIPQGTQFSFQFSGSKLVGFHGRSSFHLDSIGLYLKPLVQRNMHNNNGLIASQNCVISQSNGISERTSNGFDILVAVREKMGNMYVSNGQVGSMDKVFTTNEAVNGSSNVRHGVRDKDDYTFLPNQGYNEIYETKEKVVITSGAGKGSTNMRQTVKEKQDHMFSSPNRVYDEVETKDKVFLTAEAAKASSNMRPAVREKDDYTFVSNRVFNEFETKEKVYGTPEAAKGYPNMRQTEDHMFTSNRVFGEFETKDKKYGTTAQIAKGPIMNVRQAMSCGPWGGNGGMLFDDGVYTGVREIELTRSGGLVSIRVCYDVNGQAVWGNKNGGSGGIRLDKFTLEYPNEFLTGISGYYGSMILRGPTVIKSITFYTNKRKYGPFGDEQGIPFSSGSKDGIIVGFHGRKGWFVDCLGVHFLEGKPSLPRPINYDAYNMSDMRICEVVSGGLKGPGPCGPGPWGGEGGKPWDDGVFSGVKKIYLTKGEEGITSLQIEYDRNGQSTWSVKHGAGNGDTCHVIQFEYPHEILTCISGYYGSVGGDECKKVIKSLTFNTNRGRYGPYGEETGTYFTSNKTQGKIVGFHGKSACYLYAIGVHTQHWLNDRVEQGPIKMMLNKIFT